MLAVDSRDPHQDSDLDDDTMPDFGDHVDSEVFAQILEMDESESERDFSAPLVFNFFDQANETFQQMEKALKDKDLKKLGELGHYLKGSSATLGFGKIRDSCQVIQQYGNRSTLDGTTEPDESVCLSKITEALGSAKHDTVDLEKIMKDFFGEQ